MKISVRQICFIMIAYTAATRLLLYPTILSITCERDLLFPAIVNFAISGIVVWAVSYLCSRTDKTFFALLKDSIGDIGARIVYGLFAAFFLFISILPMFEQKLYVHNIFYDTVPSLGVFLPFFILSVYAASKHFQNIGRCADICLPIFLVSIVLIFGMAFGEAEWNNLLPILKTPAKKLLGGVAGSAYCFVEPCWLLMFMGHFKYKKGDAAKITLSYAGGALIVLIFLAMYYGVYGPVSPSRTFAVARLSLFFPAIETIGRIDIVLLFVLEVVMLFALIINIQLGVHAISECTGYKNLKVISLAANAALAAILISCDHLYSKIYNVFYFWVWIAVIVFAVAAPLLAWTLKRRKKQ